MKRSNSLKIDLYRSAGTTFKAFVDSYLGSHLELLKKLPFVTRCETYIFKEREISWPQMMPPLVDGMTLMSFDSPSSMDEVLDSPEWREVMSHLGTFVGYAPIQPVERLVFIPDPGVEAVSKGALGGYHYYRWDGTTVEEMRHHYINSHAPLGRKQPGITWYETYINTEAHEEWPRSQYPIPDGFSLEAFTSEEAMLNMSSDPMWEEELVPDAQGFVAYTPFAVLERHVVVPETTPVKVAEPSE